MPYTEGRTLQNIITLDEAQLQSVEVLWMDSGPYFMVVTRLEVLSTCKQEPSAKYS